MTKVSEIAEACADYCRVEESLERQAAPTTYIRTSAKVLLIDIDSEEALERHKILWGIAVEAGQLVGDVIINPSSTKGHYHVIVKLKKPIKKFTDRLFWHLALGSDPKRELLAYTLSTTYGEEISFFAKPGWKATK